VASVPHDKAKPRVWGFHPYSNRIFTQGDRCHAADGFINRVSSRNDHFDELSRRHLRTLYAQCLQTSLNSTRFNPDQWFSRPFRTAVLAGRGGIAWHGDGSRFSGRSAIAKKEVRPTKTDVVRGSQKQNS